MNTYKKGDLRVWWIPQVPMKAFYVPVETVLDAKLVTDTLARYDAFQYENLIKPDYSNAGGLQMYDPADIQDGDIESGWTEWYSEDGEDFDTFASRMEELVA